MDHRESLKVARMCGELATLRSLRRDLESENASLRETARLAERFARAKGRHHSQHAACDLMEHFGLPCVRPGEEAPQPTPEAWMYQHDETGQIVFVDQWQIDNGFEKNNPRLHIICPLYRHPPS